MKSKIVWLLSGLPGSGKSTWVQRQLNEKGGVWCSRDLVRFSMVKEDEPYFQRENEVFNVWINQIKNALNNPEIENVYVDATHLNDKSRNKTLNCLPKENINKIINVVFNVPIEICLERNALRTGRAVVPEEVIRNMSASFSLPKENETIFIDMEGGTRNEW